MKLSDLTADLEYRLLQGTEDKDVESLVYFSEEARPGSLFFAVPGMDKNGIAFAAAAAERGALAAVTEEVWNPPQNLSHLTVLRVENVRQTMAYISKQFFGNPGASMKLIGVTGTKGKTSTVFMLREILEQAGIRTGILSTVKNGWEGCYEPAELTTPQSVDVYRWLRRMEDNGCRALVMEVSSQAMKQYRVEGITFDIGIFTNLRPDHIGPGEHKDFAEYRDCKARLMTQCRKVVYHADEGIWASCLPEAYPPEYVTFGTGERNTYRYRSVMLTEKNGLPGVSFCMGGAALYVPLPGNFNAVNAAGAAAAARELGISWECIRTALSCLRIPGRMEPVDGCGDKRVFVDYAHNGLALEQVLRSLRKYRPERLIVVFGCGGNRDPRRRQEMGKAAAALADLTIVTSDNPRQEPPEQIIKDITDAMDQAAANGAPGQYLVEPDRKKAIVQAVTDSGKHDMILIAGKGHETYQLVKGEKIYADDRKTAADAARETGHLVQNKIMGEKET